MEVHQAWIVVERYDNWLMDKNRGFDVIGFPKSSKTLASQITKGDRLVVYIASSKSVIAGIHEVTSDTFYTSNDLLWDEIFPFRFKIKTDIILHEEKFIPIRTLINDLSFIRFPKNWKHYFRTSLRKINGADYSVIRKAVVNNLITQEH